jgi:hypothetical protein
VDGECIDLVGPMCGTVGGNAETIDTGNVGLFCDSPDGIRITLKV